MELTNPPNRLVFILSIFLSGSKHNQGVTINESDKLWTPPVLTCRAEAGKGNQRWKRNSCLVPDIEGLFPGFQMGLEENKLEFSSHTVFLVFMGDFSLLLFSVYWLVWCSSLKPVRPQYLLEKLNFLFLQTVVCCHWLQCFLHVPGL